LLDHANNPVDWYPWGEEAFRKAKAESKPIFLSIGYATCHWCHVQARESFENEETAGIMNENFVAIKVDREERPDLDEFYMKAVQALTGQGGWPLNVFLTPDLKPFYGGTYFPPEPKYGIPSFKQLLQFVSDLWKKKREDVRQSGEDISKFVRESYKIEPGSSPDRKTLDGAYASIMASFDTVNGGFGGPPKFPLPTYMMFLLRYYARTKKELALRGVTGTLEAISNGGIHDHLAGGFHRYSTDRKWLVPHFEKMLYDNALLARAYLEGFQVTKNPDYAQVATTTLDWILAEMTDPESGGFYSAQDADTTQGEGVYYTWTKEEIKKTLGEEEGEILSYVFGVTTEGNFEGGRNILHRTATFLDASRKFGKTKEELAEILSQARRTLLQERTKRPRPSVDDKVLTAWNGLTISAFSYGYQSLRNEDYLKAAKKSAEFVLKKMLQDKRLSRRYRDGEVAGEGTLDDYSFFIAGLLDLYESSFDPKYLKSALELNESMVALFWDKEKGGMFLTYPSDGIVSGIKEGYDGPTPSGNSVGASNLLRLADLTENDALKKKGEEILQLFGGKLETEPSAHTYMLTAVDYSLGSKEIVVSPGKKNASEIVQEIHSRFLPNKVLILATAERRQELSTLTPLIDGKNPIGGATAVYICEDFSCKRPTTDLEILKKQLDEIAVGS
jgi:uncharacterized protein YyaL (SSP411 family)